MTGQEVSRKSKVTGGNIRALLVHDAEVEGRRNSKNYPFNFTSINSDAL